MEYWRYVEDVSEMADTAIVLAITSLVLLACSYVISDAFSTAALTISILIGVVATALSWGSLNKSKTTRQRHTRLLVTVSIPLAMLALLSLDNLQVNSLASISQPGIKTNEVATRQQVNQDPELLAALQTIGAKGDYSDLTLTLHGSDMSRLCGHSNSLACYRKDSEENHSIAISRLAVRYDINTALAHEYMHYSWQQHSLDNDKILTSNLIDLYAKSQTLQNNMQVYYVETGALSPDEIFSHACTTLPSNELGGYISSKCSEFIDINQLRLKSTSQAYIASGNR